MDEFKRMLDEIIAEKKTRDAQAVTRAELLNRHPTFRHQLFCLVNGLPWEYVVNLSEVELLAFAVTIQELKTGKSFNWETRSWPE